MPSLATEFGKDGVVYFYGTEIERIKATEKRAKVEIQTRALSSFYIRGFRMVMWDKPKGRVNGVNGSCSIL